MMLKSENAIFIIQIVNFMEQEIANRLKKEFVFTGIQFLISVALKKMIVMM